MSFKNGNMRDNFLFQHGWGFDRTCWKPLISIAQQKWFYFSERGYFNLSGNLDDLPGRQDVKTVVCHSLGLHLLPQEFLINCQVLVLVGCFQSFHGENEREGRFTRRHVQKMFKGLQENCIELLTKFHERCEYTFSPTVSGSIREKLLVDDLRLLDMNVFDLTKLYHIPRILILHGENDRTVPVQRSKDLASKLKNAKFVSVKDAGHGLPFTHPQLCWEHIKNSTNIE